MYQPYPSSGQGPEPARRQPPAAVVMAVRFMYAGAIVSGLSLIVSLITIGSLQAQIHQADPRLSSGQVHTAEIAAVGVAVFFGLVGVGLWIWMALANRAGRGWARIVASVLFGLDTLFLLLGFARPATLGTRLVSIVIWLLGLGAIVFLWRRESSEYFSAPGAR
jgi:hypothetical protein